MKLIRNKSIEIFTDGTINFSHISKQSEKQTIFYEKDGRASLFFKKIRKKQLFQSLQKNLYKSKYKF